MARPKVKQTIEACNKDDLIIDVISDIIARDSYRMYGTRVSNNDAIRMRDNFNKLDKVIIKYNELKEAKGVDSGSGKAICDDM